MSVLEALKTVAPPDPIDPIAIQVEIDALDKAFGELLPVESAAREHVWRQKEPLTRAKSVYDFWLKTEQRYQLISSEVLKWRWALPLEKVAESIPVPRLALVSVSNSAGTMVLSPEGTRVPWGLESSYEDVIRELRRLHSRSGMMRGLTYQFTGVIPAETRSKIKQADPFFNPSKSHSRDENIFLLCDAPIESWTFGEVAPLPQMWDPIVVGFAKGELWYIDNFDPTPIEDYVSREFTSIPEPVAPAVTPEMDTSKRGWKPW